MKLRFTIRDLLWLTAVVGVLMALSLIGCRSPLDFGTEYEQRDITFNQLHALLPDLNLDLQNASHIYVAYASSRDSSDFWLKCNMTKAAFDALAAKASQNAEVISPFFDVDDDLCAAAPPWWRFHSGGRKHLWLRRNDDGSSHRYGSVLCFDEESRTLRIWQWSTQWESVKSTFDRKW